MNPVLYTIQTTGTEEEGDVSYIVVEVDTSDSLKRRLIKVYSTREAAEALLIVLIRNTQFEY